MLTPSLLTFARTCFAMVLLVLMARSPAVAQEHAAAGDAAKAVARTPVIPRKLLFGNPDKAGAKISPEPIGEALDGSTITVPAGAEGVPGLSAAMKKRVLEKGTEK